MGIQDRDYYRNEGPSIFDTLVPHGVVCRWLITINVVVFLLQMVAYSTVGRAFPVQLPDGQIVLPDIGQGWVTDWFILDASKVMDGQVWRLLTYAFLHAPDSYWHILFNMLFLWWFGSDVEQLYGRMEFLAIYLTSALLGGIAYVAWRVAMGGHNPCLGASGAVSTMLILCALHFPRRVIYIMFFFPMPIWLFALFNFAKDAYLMLNEWQAAMRDGHPGAYGNVAWQVHLAGAVFAVAYYQWQGSITGLLNGLMHWRHRRPARSRLKLFEPSEEKHEPVAVAAKTSPQQVAADEHLEAKLDAVLEKIAKKGKESLTEQEQEILVKAAEMYKRRRT